MSGRGKGATQLLPPALVIVRSTLECGVRLLRACRAGPDLLQPYCCSDSIWRFIKGSGDNPRWIIAPLEGVLLQLRVLQNPSTGLAQTALRISGTCRASQNGDHPAEFALEIPCSFPWNVDELMDELNPCDKSLWTWVPSQQQRQRPAEEFEIVQLPATTFKEWPDGRDPNSLLLLLEQSSDEETNLIRLAVLFKKPFGGEPGARILQLDHSEAMEVTTLPKAVILDVDGFQLHTSSTTLPLIRRLLQVPRSVENMQSVAYLLFGAWNQLLSLRRLSHPDADEFELLHQELLVLRSAVQDRYVVRLHAREISIAKKQRTFTFTTSQPHKTIIKFEVITAAPQFDLTTVHPLIIRDQLALIWCWVLFGQWEVAWQLSQMYAQHSTTDLNRSSLEYEELPLANCNPHLFECSCTFKTQSVPPKETVKVRGSPTRSSMTGETRHLLDTMDILRAKIKELNRKLTTTTVAKDTIRSILAGELSLTLNN